MICITFIYNILEKSLCETSFQIGINLKKYENKAEMKECEEDCPTAEEWRKRKTKDYPTSAKKTANVG